MASLASSFSGMDNGADPDPDTSVVGAGELDLGDFTRLAPFLFDSATSLFAIRTLALREVDTSICCVSEGAL